MENVHDKPYIGSPDNSRTAAVVSYITFIGWLIAYFGLYPQRKIAHTSFHLRQSLLIHIVSFLIKIVYSFWPFSTALLVVICILTTGLFILWFMGFWDALSGERKPVPLIGTIAQHLFRRI